MGPLWILKLAGNKWENTSTHVRWLSGFCVAQSKRGLRTEFRLQYELSCPFSHETKRSNVLRICVRTKLLMAPQTHLLPSFGGWMESWLAVSGQAQWKEGLALLACLGPELLGLPLSEMAISHPRRLSLLCDFRDVPLVPHLINLLDMKGAGPLCPGMLAMALADYLCPSYTDEGQGLARAMFSS